MNTVVLSSKERTNWQRKDHKGLSLLRSDDIKGTRERAKERNVRDRKLMDVIGRCIENAMNERRSTRLKPKKELVEYPDW